MELSVKNINFLMVVLTMVVMVVVVLFVVLLIYSGVMCLAT